MARMDSLGTNNRSRQMDTRSFRYITGELNNIGVLLYECNKFDDAIELYRDAIEVDVERHACLESLQPDEMCKRLNVWHEKLANRRGICSHLHLHPCRDTNWNLPFSSTPPIQMFQQHRLPHVFSEALPVNDSMDDDSTALVLLHNMALAQLHKGRKGNAVELLEMAMSKTPKEIDARSTAAIACIAVHYNLGLLHFQAGKEGEATTMLADAVRLGKPLLGSHVLVARVLGTVGLIMMNRGDVSYGMGLLEKASTTVNQETIETIRTKIQKEGKDKTSNGRAAAA